MIISFEDYCEDILDLQITLMSVADLRECKAAYTSYINPAYTSYINPAKKVAKENHPDSHLKLADLKTKAKRLMSNQVYAVNKYGDSFDVSLSVSVVAKATELSESKVTKAKLLDLITLNSQASRALNNQIN